jgi:hypothetical protein
VNKEELTKHARRVVMRSAHLAAAERGDRPLLSISPHVSVGGGATWAGNDDADFHFENGHAEEGSGEGCSAEDGSHFGSLDNGTPTEWCGNA